MTDKYRLMFREEGLFTVTLMARLLGVSRTGYYTFKAHRAAFGDDPVPGSRAARRAWLADRIWLHWDRSKGRHGARRIQADLVEHDGEQVSLWLIRKIMNTLGIAGVQPRATKRTTIPADDADARPDRVRRRFAPPLATSTLVGDITYLKTGEGWLYLATVIDLTTRMVVGWATASHMRTPLISQALVMAHTAGYVAGNAIFHSDRGSQYTSEEFATTARLLDVRLSVGRTGVCWDNAVAESFFASLKKEMFHQQSFTTRARARVAVAEYIEVDYNRRRRHSAIGYRIPAVVMGEFKARWSPEPEQSQSADLAA